MSKSKWLIAAALVAGGGILVWWRPSAPRAHPVASGTPMKTTAANVPRAVQRPSGPNAAVPAAKTSVPDWETRLQRIANLVGKISQAELNLEIEDLARDLPDEEMMTVLNLQLLPDTDKMPVVNALCILLFHRWAERAPAEAAQWLGQVRENRFSLAAYKQVAAAWAAADLAGALTWLEKLPESGGKAAAQLAVAAHAAEKNRPVTAIKLLSDLPPGAERDRWLKYSALQWATIDRNGALAWVGKLPDAAMREDVLAKVAVSWGAIDAAAAAAFVATSVPPGRKQESAAADIARFWTVNSPEQAAAWAEQLPEGPLRSVALEGVAEVWARTNATTAAAWLSRLPAGPSRDTAVSMFAPILAKSSLEQAVRWAETIQDATLRTNALAGVKSK